jgi:hypothetical protein
MTDDVINTAARFLAVAAAFFFSLICLTEEAF